MNTITVDNSSYNVDDAIPCEDIHIDNHARETIDLDDVEEISKPKKVVTLDDFINVYETKCNEQNSQHKLQSELINEDISKKPYICIERIKFDEELFNYYTGLENYHKFKTAFYSLSPDVNNEIDYLFTKSCDILTTMNQFLLMLVYLRCHYPVIELSRMFSISKTTVTNVVFSWINFCSKKWKKINIWPDMKVVQYYAPSDFNRLFSTTRVIIDGTEIPIEKPSNPSAQRQTWSTYKHKNTVKFLIGATPKGLISFVTEAYGGSTSDRQLIERSNLLDLVERGDVIMADKGFNVQDIFAAKDVKVNMPTFLTKKNRLSPGSIKADRKISKKRVHIERIIGNVKSFKILTENLNRRETQCASDIIFVCCMLTNFRNFIVPDTA